MKNTGWICQHSSVANIPVTLVLAESINRMKKLLCLGGVISENSNLNAENNSGIRQRHTQFAEKGLLTKELISDCETKALLSHHYPYTVISIWNLDCSHAM